MRPRRIRRGSAPSSRRAECGLNRGFNEAPANSPGIGLRRHRSTRIAMSGASMRPRRIRRGSARRGGLGAGDQYASMRPRRIRRGSAGEGRRRIAGQPPRFNEAPANSPGIGADSTTSPTATSPGFNEAPANSPGIGERRVRERNCGQGASMRPRRIRRGSGGSARSSRPRSSCFNEAPANSPGIGQPNMVVQAAPERQLQ